MFWAGELTTHGFRPISARGNREVECLSHRARWHEKIKRNQLCLTRGFFTDKPVALGFQMELESGNVGFLGGRKSRRTRRKNPQSKDENQKNTQPTYDVGCGNRTRAIFVGGNCSHHYAIPAPQSLFILVVKFYARSFVIRIAAVSLNSKEHFSTKSIENKVWSFLCSH